VNHDGVDVEAGSEHKSLLRLCAQVRTVGREGAKGDSRLAVRLQDRGRRQPHFAHDWKLPGAAATRCRSGATQRYIVIQGVSFESDDGESKLHHGTDDKPAILIDPAIRKYVGERHTDLDAISQILCRCPTG